MCLKLSHLNYLGTKIQIVLWLIFGANIQMFFTFENKRNVVKW